LRAAWRKIIRVKNPTDLVFVDEYAHRTPRWHPYTGGRVVESGCTKKRRATGART
jgi:hypothetical protein